MIWERVKLICAQPRQKQNAEIQTGTIIGNTLNAAGRSRLLFGQRITQSWSSEKDHARSQRRSREAQVQASFSTNWQFSSFHWVSDFAPHKAGPPRCEGKGYARFNDVSGWMPGSFFDHERRLAG